MLALAALERDEPRASLAWTVEFIATAKRQLAKLNRHWQAAILDYLEDEIAALDDPRSRSKPLVGDKKGLWR